LEGLARELGSALGRLGMPPEQIESTVRESLRPALERLDVVTREDHEALRAELQRTQERLAAVEARLADLESAYVGPDEPGSTGPGGD
jgi:BMFP domain-containing protein YqiC